jgi:hypothetical protein
MDEEKVNEKRLHVQSSTFRHFWMVMCDYVFVCPNDGVELSTNVC